MILGIDLGTTVVKAVLWGPEGMVASGRSALETSRPAPDRVEQDPAGWWSAVVAATREVSALAAAGGARSSSRSAIDAIGFSTARQTFVPVDHHLLPLGPALVWSDRRAGREAEALAGALGGGDAVARRTGVPIDGAAVAAKIAWLAGHEPARLEHARWLLGPRDLVAARMTGQVVTDRTVAARSGLYDAAGSVVPELAGPAAGLLPPPVEPAAVVGALRAEPAAELGLAPGIPVVAGAGDRACEVVGTGAAPDSPMVSWGTTANVSVPSDSRHSAPAGLVVSRAAGGGHLIEAGLSGAGSVLDWLARLTGRTNDDLAAAAGAAPPGSAGVLAVPWIDGARAPWWRPEAGAALLGLSAAHTPGHLARAVFEGVATEVARALDAVAGTGAAPRPRQLCLCGGGAAGEPWPGILAAVAGLPVTRRRSTDAGSAGAAIIAAGACGTPLDLDRMNPVSSTAAPDPEAEAFYRSQRDRADRAARAVLGLTP